MDAPEAKFLSSIVVHLLPARPSGLPPRLTQEDYLRE